MLNSYSSPLHAVILGGGGGLGAAFVDCLQTALPNARLSVLARRPKAQQIACDITDETSLAAAAEKLAAHPPIDVLVNATGLLHDSEAEIAPEKSLRQIEAAIMAQVLAVNAIGPALVLRHFLPLMRKDGKAVMAHLSARVGSISDNRLGGWYSYRAAKAAQNMIVKNAAIEVARRHRDLLIVGLHPGTVDTKLSAPFQGNVAAGKLFSPQQSAGYLLHVLDGLSREDSGHVFDWQGQQIPA